MFILLTDYESATIPAVRRIKYHKESLHFSSTEYYSTYLPRIKSFSNNTSPSQNSVPSRHKIIQLTMASRTSNPTTCPVCSKEFNAKREKVALNQHIQRAAASKDPTISKSQQQWLDDHTVHDNERERARNLAALNSARVQRWRASHLEKYKEQNANAQKKRKLQR